MKVTVTNASGLCAEASAGEHRVVVDESIEVGGTDTAFSPKELLLVSLGTCTVITLRMYAERKEWPLECATVTVHYEPADLRAGTPHKLLQEVTLVGPLDEAQRARLLDISGRCPVHRIIEGPTEFEERLVEPVGEGA